MDHAELQDSDYVKISQLVYEQCGIDLGEGKKELVKVRLGKRLREGNFKSFSDYYRYVTTAEGMDELIKMIDSLSTNLTSFFREANHFNTVRQVVQDKISARRAGETPKVRIWSAGCSTGEEPYTLAIVLTETIKGAACDAKILATDISTRVLKTAMDGIYRDERLQNIERSLLKKYFQIGSGKYQGYYRIKQAIRGMIQFERFNLMDTPPASFRFDMIFCRNVMIYFDKPTQSGLVNRFYQCLHEGGYLFIGHSESLTGLNHSFNYVEPNVYRK
ncbi:MAG: protein-glutamate O-methyltransferase [Syntrophaceae bacterium]|nr:protein-glutamate O-methyltransferase [Syntrophaceae bacterium]